MGHQLNTNRPLCVLLWTFSASLEFYLTVLNITILTSQTKTNLLSLNDSDLRTIYTCILYYLLNRRQSMKFYVSLLNGMGFFTGFNSYLTCDPY